MKRTSGNSLSLLGVQNKDLCAALQTVLIRVSYRLHARYLGLVDFAIGLVNSVINLANGQVEFFEEFKLQKNCEINLLIKTFLGLVEMLFGLMNFSFNLPKWQAVKMTSFAP